jgi:2-polyprenyl-6-methoxyphenol hydroxylase-like FAD-dependent oxidoreductase
VWRADLYRGLYDEAARRGVRIEHGKRLVRLRDTGDGVTAYFEDGSQAQGDILIGADGIRSTVRTLIDTNAPKPRYTGLLGMGGRAADLDLKLPSTHGSMHMVFGKRAFFAYQVADDGRVGWFANREWLRVMADTFADDRTPAVDILRSIDPASLVVVGALEDLPTVPTWSKGRTVLVGDSAHATSPSSGQGASQAVESSIQLTRCLRDLPVDQAFAAYEDLRRGRVERIIAAGARSNSDKAAGPVARIFRDLLMPVAMKMLAKPEKMAWQNDYRIDWNAPVSPRTTANAH